jgi:hypothetical protein
MIQPDRCSSLTLIQLLGAGTMRKLAVADVSEDILPLIVKAQLINVKEVASLYSYNYSATSAITEVARPLKRRQHNQLQNGASTQKGISIKTQHCYKVYSMY